MKANFKIETKEAVFQGGTVGGQWGWTLIETEGLGTPPEGPSISPPPGINPPPTEPVDPVTTPVEPTKPTKPTKPDDEASILPMGITAVDAGGEPIVWQTQEAFASIDVDPEVTYKISVVRLDADSNPLGAPVSSVFTTEAEPADVVIQVASVLTVEVLA